MTASKKIYLIRHAKSSWGDLTRPDFERTLNERGLRDAPIMAERMKSRGVQPDAFVSSPATRAKQTAEFFCRAYQKEPSQILFIPKLYHAQVSVFQAVIESLDDQLGEVALFSHNPGITEFANSLCSNVRIDNMPTCGIFGVEIFASSWASCLEAKKTLLFFDYPKSVTS